MTQRRAGARAAHRIYALKKFGFRPGMMEDSKNMLGSLRGGLNNEEPTMVESLFRS